MGGSPAAQENGLDWNRTSLPMARKTPGVRGGTQPHASPGKCNVNPLHTHQKDPADRDGQYLVGKEGGMLTRAGNGSTTLGTVWQPLLQLHNCSGQAGAPPCAPGQVLQWSGQDCS